MKHLLFLFFFSGSLWAAQLTRPDGSAITYHLDEAVGAEAYPLIVVLTGSECGSSLPRHEWAKKIFTDKPVALLSLDKPGIHGPFAGACPEEYLKTNSLKQRVEDHLLVLERLRADLPKWNRKIFWIGGSEGAMLAGVVSPLVPETAAAVMIAGGGGLSFADELEVSLPRMMKSQGAPEDAVQRMMDEFRSVMREARLNPTWEKSWGGETNTYKWWHSVIDVKVIDHLRDSDFPMLLVHGDADLSAPVEGSDIFFEEFQRAGKTHLDYFRYPGLDHGLKDASGQSFMEKIVKEDVLPWLTGRGL